MDRIRENTRHARKESYAQIADKSILETMTRSINTTVTTLLTIGMVYILGVASIQKFSLPIIIGILLGCSLGNMERCRCKEQADIKEIKESKVVMTLNEKPQSPKRRLGFCIIVDLRFKLIYSVKPLCVAFGDADKFIIRYAFNVRHFSCDKLDISAEIPLAAVRLGRHIGTVGFYHKPVERNGGASRDCLFGVFKCQNACERNHHTEFENFARRFGAARKTVYNSV